MLYVRFELTTFYSKGEAPHTRLTHLSLKVIITVIRVK